ncbi:hypothetical protein ABDJ38_02815 [Aurantiacibacter sp. DGU5]|uniref:Uncharacterized protein n=1 Tax=Aurantiacibacter flavus TaxID=3145232 RepID=A0ABV0CTW3_9SPHN
MSARPAISAQRQFLCQPHHHAFHISHYLFIGEPNDAEPGPLFERSVAALVLLRIVRVPVDLDGQSFGRTEKIDNPRTQHSLTAKLEVRKATLAQLHPQAAFWLTGIATHFYGALEQDFARCSTAPNPLL